MYIKQLMTCLQHLRHLKQSPARILWPMSKQRESFHSILETVQKCMCSKPVITKVS